MGKTNVTELFEKHFLNSLVEDKSSCVEIQEQNYHLALHPFHLNNVNESLKDILNQGIAKYDQKLNGILLGYQNIKLLSQSGVVTNDSFFIHIDILASFFLFKPEEGKILTGTVNKKSKDHVACLVHKTFNISLPKPEQVDDEDDDWMGAKVEIGQDILFRITFVNLEGRLPYIRAEFVAILGEQDSGISTSEENVEKKSSKANKKIVFESNSEGEETATTKKKKKRKKEEDSESEEQEKPRRKKHKHKSSIEENLDLVDGEKKKKSKHKQEAVSGIWELEADEDYNHKKKKSKNKNASHEVEAEERISIAYDTHSKKNEKEIVTRHEESTTSKRQEKKNRKKESKHNYDLEEHIDLAEVTVEEDKPKKKKSKHKDRSHEVQAEEIKLITYNTHPKEEEKVTRDEESSPTRKHYQHKDQPDKEENVSFERKKKQKKSKHKHDLEEDIDVEDKPKKNKSKHKDRSHELEAEEMQFIEYDTHSKKKEKEIITRGEEPTPSRGQEKHKDQPDEEENVSLKKKNKKSKHKNDLEEVIDVEDTPKKKKKSKHKDSLEDLTNAVLQKTLLRFAEKQAEEGQKSTDKKKRKSKDKNESDDVLNSSLLPELNLSNLFRESVSNRSSANSNFQMADNEDKFLNKRRSSTTHVNFWDGKTELMVDSDLEKIIQDVDKGHKHNKEGRDTVSPKLIKKRRRSSSSDDFVTPAPKKKHKKDLEKLIKME